MKVAQISSAVINALQMFIDNQDLGLKVGPISDDDYRILTSGYSELEWCWGLQEIGNSDDKFEFSVKIKENGVPDGAMLGLYNVDSNILEIHFIESFIRHDKQHPLNGRMVAITIIAAYLFISAVDGDSVQIIEPTTNELIKYYAKYGFILNKESEQIIKLSASKEVLEEHFKNFTP